MTFSRAIIIAIMARGLVEFDSDVVGSVLVIAVCWILWTLTNDPLPAAIKRGLETFAKDYRR